MKMRIITLVLGVLAANPVWAQQSPTDDERPKITVSGEAVVNVKPDKVVLWFGIETNDNDIMVAKKKSAALLKSAFAAVKGCGVPEKDIQTDYLSIQPRWEDEMRGARRFSGYFTTNRVEVTLLDAEKLEGLVTSLLQAGVNYIYGIEFQTIKLKEYREQARELALRAAKEKAEKMAGVLGQSIGAPLQLSEVASAPRYSSRSSYNVSQTVADSFSGGAGEATETVALGKIAVRANVSVTFELKK